MEVAGVVEEVAGGGGGGGGVEKMWRRGEEMEEGGEGERSVEEKGRGERKRRSGGEKRKEREKGAGGIQNFESRPIILWRILGICATEFFSLFLIFFLILLGKFFCWP